MAHVFYTSADSLTRAEGWSENRSRDELRAAALIEGMPFALTDDGLPIRPLNHWLRSLPINGCSSPQTWKAYAYDLIDWLEFLQVRGHDLLAGDSDDLSAYHGERRLGDAGLKRVLSASSWRRVIK